MTPAPQVYYGNPIPSADVSAVTVLLFVPLLVLTLLAVASSPLYATLAIVTGLGIGKILQVGLTAYIRRTADHIREVTFPGIGTVRFRIVPR